MDRYVDIATDGVHLSVLRGFMLVRRDGEELGRVALDDIAAVIVHAHGVTFSANLCTRLAQRGALIVFCGPNHAPHSLLWPLEGHHAQGGRMQAQLAASKPLKKNLWKKVVVAKIRMQQAILRAAGENADAFDRLARKVRSGDPENVEAQAARRYWPLLFGPGFQRDRNAHDVNVLLNYGYTVLRACVARAVIAAGLHPTLGIHHHNRANAFALADDLMEPFRPLVDWTARQLLRDNFGNNNGGIVLDSQAKERLVRMLSFDLLLPESRTPVSGCVQRLSVSLARSFEQRRAMLEFPVPPKALELAEL